MSSTGHSLYLLVCAAGEGPLAGLFKVGVAVSFPFRYSQHRQTWGAFDLPRCALVVNLGRREARKLESAVRAAFGNPDAEAEAMMAGKALANADFVAMESCRRHPGRQDDGWTEFYTTECLEDVLAFIEGWIKARRRRKTRPFLQRSLTAADCALFPGVEAGSLLTKEAKIKSRLQRQLCHEQEHAELLALIAAKMGQVLDLALQFEEHLVWVDLTRWQWQREEARPAQFADGLADLYFDGLSPTTTGNVTRTEPRLAAWARFEERLARIESAVAAPPNLPYLHYRQSAWEQRQQVCSLDEPPFRIGEPPPHRLCDDKMRLRLEPFEIDAIQPFFGQFEALAERVQQRRSWEQAELRW